MKAGPPVSSRALHEQLSPRRARQRRARNGWLTLLSIVCLSLCVDLAAHLAQLPNPVTAHAHNAVKTVVPARLPPGCGAPDAAAQRQATMALPRSVTLPATIAPLRVARDANGTLVIMCMAAAPQAGHDAIQQALLARQWQIAADITATSTLSLTFLRDGVVMFVTIAAQPTTPPTTQIIMMMPT